MDKLIFVSDLHICAPGEQIIGLDPSERLEAVLDHALEHHSDARALVFLGDLTHHGKTEEFHELKRIIADCPIPIIPMLGNHDRREAFLNVFDEAPLSPSGHVQSVLDIGNARLITLDSLDGPPFVDGHHSGRLCENRLAFLQDALEQREDRFAIVCVHHPPFDTGIVGMDRIKMTDGDRFLDILAQHRNLHLMCGHVHRTISGTSKGVAWTVLKSPCHQGVLELVSPNSHLSTDEHGAYAVALLHSDGLVIHHQDVATGARIFGGYAKEG